MFGPEVVQSFDPDSALGLVSTETLVCRYVVIAMEALDQLLMACHSQSIKPFVESFLHMVAKLLESREPDLQVLGTNSVRRSGTRSGCIEACLSATSVFFLSQMQII